MTAPPMTHANGVTHPSPPQSLPLLPRGPVSQWPRLDSESDTSLGEPSPVAEPAPAKALRRRSSAVSRLHAPDADTVITWAMTATVALVAVDAAIVSYSHIYGLATGQLGSGAETGVQARLLPLSIDGVIAEASLVLLYAARHHLVRKPRLATFMLWLGIVATVAANVTHGLPSSLLPPVAHTVIMALLSAWPAGAFIGSVEMAMGLVRDKRAVEAGDTGDAGDSDTGSTGGSRPPRQRRPRKPRRHPVSRHGNKPPAAPPGDSDPVAKAISAHPSWKAKRGLTTAEKDAIAQALGVTRRTVERHLTTLRRTAGK